MYIDDDLALKFSECVVKSKQIHATFHENWLETTRSRLAKDVDNRRNTIVSGQNRIWMICLL